MPSNKDLIENINKVATEKGVEVPNTVGLNNNDLNETLKSLRALEVKPTESNESTEESEELVPGADESTEDKTDEDPEAEKEADEDVEKVAEEKAQKIKDDKIKAEKVAKDKIKAEAKAKADAIPPYRVAPGKSITSKKGVLDEGDEVKAEYLPGGQETLDNNVDLGHIIKK